MGRDGGGGSHLGYGEERIYVDCTCKVRKSKKIIKLITALLEAKKDFPDCYCVELTKEKCPRCKIDEALK